MPYIGNVPAESYSQVSYQDLTGGSGTSFTLDYPVGSAGEIEVFVNNVRQEPTVAYTVNGTALTMTGSVAATDDFYIVFQGKAEKSGTIPEKQANGDYNFDSNTLFIDSSASSVGVGTATPTVPLQVNGSGVYLAGIESSTAYAFMGLKDSNSSGTIADPQVGVGVQTNDLLFRAGGAERARILSSGGITFNGDTAAANALDDYEEGTWTPTSLNGSVTSYSNAFYTKIGNTVHLHAGGIRLSDTTTTSAIKIYGHPFATNNRSMGSMMIRYAGTTSGYAVYLAGDYIELFRTTNTASWVQLKHSDLTSTSCDLYFSITYQTAA